MNLRWESPSLPSLHLASAVAIWLVVLSALIWRISAVLLVVAKKRIKTPIKQSNGISPE